MAKKQKISGIDNAFAKLLKEKSDSRKGQIQSISELVDNSIDAIRKKRKKYNTYETEFINITIDVNENVLVCEDTGISMVSRIEKIFKEYESHVTESNCNTIGVLGRGMKDTSICMSDFFGNGSDVIIHTRNMDGVVEHAHWSLSKRKPLNEIFIYDDNEYDIPYEINSDDSGTVYELHCIDNIFKAPGFISKLKSDFSQAYAYIILSENIEISINGESVKTKNKFNFEDIIENDLINKRSFKVINGNVYNSINYEFVKQSTKETIKCTLISEFTGFNEPDNPKEKGFKNQPFCVLFSGRNITPGASCDDMYTNPLNRGGVWGVRQILIIDGLKNGVNLGVNSKKSTGIIPFKENEKLWLEEHISEKDTFCFYNKKTGQWMSAYECFDREYRLMGKINEFRSSASKNNEALYKELLEDDKKLEHVLREKYVLKYTCQTYARNKSDENKITETRCVPDSVITDNRLNTKFHYDFIPECDGYDEWVKIYKNDAPLYAIANVWHSSHSGGVEKIKKVITEIIKQSITIR